MEQHLIEKAYALADEIKSQKTYKTLVSLEQKIASSPRIEGLIDAFKSAEEKYRDAKKYGSYHPDLAHYQKAFQAAKRELFSEPLVKAYKETERALSSFLDAITSEIAGSVSDKINIERSSVYSSLGGRQCKKENV